MNLFASLLVVLSLGMGIVVMVDSVSSHHAAQASCDPPPDPPKPPKK